MIRALSNLRRVRSENQAGVTLIVAMLVLSIVTVLSFSMAALVVREIKISRQLSKSEPAIVAAEAGAETALFYRLRSLKGEQGIPDEAFTACTSSIGTQGTLGDSTYEYCQVYYDNPYIFGSHGDAVEVVVLYNPEDPTSLAAGYTSVMITATSSSATTNVLRIDNYDLSDVSSGPSSSIISVPGSTTLGGLDPASSYAIFLYPCNDANNPPACGASDRVSGMVSTVVGPSAGIPAKYPKIRSKGMRDDLIRQLEIQLYGGQ